MIKKAFNSYKAKSIVFLAKSIFGKDQNNPKVLLDDLTDPIVLVFAANDSYSMMLAATLKSVILNHSTKNELVFYIIDDKVSPVNKLKIEETVGGAAPIHWIVINDAFLMKFGLLDSYSKLTPHYWRLLIPYFVPENVKRVIYLDCDLIVLKDIYHLWSLDFDGNTVMAVQDTRFPLVEDTIRNHVELGMNGKAKYFNSGVLVIDLNKWREEKVSELVIKCVEENWDIMLYDDQYGLNVILYQKWKSLNPNWNLAPEFFPSMPYILHYISVKPTSPNYANFNRHYFYRYLDQTSWKGWRPKNVLITKLF